MIHSIFKVLWIMNGASLVAVQSQAPATIPDPPTLTVSNSKLTIGCSSTLTCTEPVPNIAFPDIHWQKDSVAMTQRSASITFLNMAPTDGGLFLCAKCITGLTSYSSAASKCITSNFVEIIVEGLPPPVATSSRGQLVDFTDPAANKPVDLACQINCPDVNFEFKWWRNGVAWNARSKTLNQQSFSVPGDNGYYQCSMKHKTLNVESKLSNEIRVILPESCPNICQDCVGGALEHVGGNATFECSARSVGTGALVDALFIYKIAMTNQKVNDVQKVSRAAYTPLLWRTGLENTGSSKVQVAHPFWTFDIDGGLEDNDTTTKTINNAGTAKIKVTMSKTDCDIAGRYECTISYKDNGGNSVDYCARSNIFLTSKVDSSLGHFRVEKTGALSAGYSFTCSAQFNSAAAKMELSLLPCTADRFTNTSDRRLSSAFTDSSNDVCDEMVVGGPKCMIRRTVIRQFKFNRDMCTARCAIFTTKDGQIQMLNYHDFHFKDVCKVSDKIHKLWKWYSTVLVAKLAICIVAGTVFLIKLFYGGGLNVIIKGVSCVLRTLIMSTCGPALLCILVVSETCLDAVVPRYRAVWARLGECLDRLKGKKEPLKQIELPKTVRKNMIQGQMKNLTGNFQAKTQKNYRGRERARSHVSYWSDDSGHKTMYA